MIKKFIFGALVAMTLSSCYTFTQYQTGRTVGKGNTDYGITVNGLGAAGDGGFGNLPPFKPEFQMSYGISDNLDAIFKYSALAGLHAGLKYSIFGNNEDSQFAGAIGANIGGLFLSGGNEDSEFTTGGFLNVSVPLHLSYHPSESFAFGVSPNYSLVSGFGDDGTIGSFNAFGVAPHFEIGRRVKFIFGVNFLFGLDDGLDGTFYEYGLGLKWSPRN